MRERAKAKPKAPSEFKLPDSFFDQLCGLYIGGVKVPGVHNVRFEREPPNVPASSLGPRKVHFEIKLQGNFNDQLDSIRYALTR